MKRYIIPILAIFATLVACKKEDILVYDSTRPSLNFVKSNFTPTLYYDPDLDTLKLAAVFYAGQQEIDYKLPMQLSGAITKYDRNFDMRVSAEKSYGDLIEGVHYSLPEKQILHAGLSADSAIVRIHIEKLRADKVSGTLVFEFVPNETFEAGLDNYQTIGVAISGEGFTSQPVFWQKNNLDTYGGTYSSIKAEKYVELNGIPNDLWREYNTAKLYAYGKRTYEWFRDNPTYDNGELVEFKGSIIYE